MQVIRGFICSSFCFDSLLLFGGNLLRKRTENRVPRTEHQLLLNALTKIMRPFEYLANNLTVSRLHFSFFLNVKKKTGLVAQLVNARGY